MKILAKNIFAVVCLSAIGLNSFAEQSAQKFVVDSKLVEKNSEHWAWCKSKEDSGIGFFLAFGTSGETDHENDSDEQFNSFSVMSTQNFLFDALSLGAVKISNFDGVLPDANSVDKNTSELSVKMLSLSPLKKVIGRDGQDYSTFSTAIKVEENKLEPVSSSFAINDIHISKHKLGIINKSIKNLTPGRIINLSCEAYKMY